MCLILPLHEISEDSFISSIDLHNLRAWYFVLKLKTFYLKEKLHSIHTMPELLFLCFGAVAKKQKDYFNISTAVL